MDCVLKVYVRDPWPGRRQRHLTEWSRPAAVNADGDLSLWPGAWTFRTGGPPSASACWCSFAIRVLSQTAWPPSTPFTIPEIPFKAAIDLLNQGFPAAAGTSARIVFAAPTRHLLTEPSLKAAVEAGPSEHRRPSGGGHQTLHSHNPVGAENVIRRPPPGEGPRAPGGRRGQVPTRRPVVDAARSCCTE